MLLTPKYNVKKHLQSSNRLNLNQNTNTIPTDLVRNDVGIRQVFRKKQHKILSKSLLNSSPRTFNNPSRKEMYEASNTPILLSTLARKNVQKSTSFFVEKYLTVQQFESQIKNRLTRIESSRRVLNSSISVERNAEQTQELISFWKKTYPYSLRILDATNQPLILKKSSKIRKPIRKIFLKLKSYDRLYTLLNKNLLSSKTNYSTLHPEEEIGFSKKSNVLKQKYLINNTPIRCLNFIQLNISNPNNQLTIPHFSQNYYSNYKTPNLFWYTTLPLTLTVANLNTTFNLFFYKNLNLINQLNGSFNQKLFYQNHFFTMNRENLVTPILQTVTKTNTPLLPTFRFKTPNFKYWKKNLLFYKNYFLFIEFSKKISQWSTRRPIYSHLFSKNFLHKRFLITITAASKTIPYWKRISQQRNTQSLSRGLSTTFLYKDNDNFFENNFDNHLSATLLQTNQTHFSLVQYRLYATLLKFFSEKPKLLTPYNALPVATHKPLVENRTNDSFQNLFPTSNNYNLLHGNGGDLLVFTNPLLFKFLFWNTLNDVSQFQNATLPLLIKNQLKNTPLMATNPLLKSNLIPLTFFKHTIRRKVIKLVVSSKYLPRTTTYFYRSLIQFMEFFTGKKIYLKFNPFIENSLTYTDLARCYMWFGRVNPYQRILGHRIFVHESLRIFHLALRFKDPTFLSNWIKAMLYRMSFWKYRVLFRYIKYVLRNLFWAHFDELGFKGIKLTLRGKISVAGNARTRTLTFAVGKTSHSEMNNKVLSDFTNIHSFTGVMGFRLSFYF